MNGLLDELKKHGWSDELLASIEKISKTTKSPTISTSIAPMPNYSLDLHVLSVSQSELRDSNSLIVH